MDTESSELTSNKDNNLTETMVNEDVLNVDKKAINVDQQNVDDKIANKSVEAIETTSENNENVKKTIESPLKLNISIKNSDGSPKTLLDREQIKKRLQAYSLMKQGIQALPVKKFTKPIKMSVQIVGEEIYDENGEKQNEKVVIKRPSKKG